jgi:pyruvate kinase
LIYKKTKIICTIGPAVATVEDMVNLINSGMDAARLNFSHGDHSMHQKYIDNIREAGSLTGKMIAIIQDLSGPKIRVGKLENGYIELKENQEIRISGFDITGNESVFSTNYSEIVRDVKKNEVILLDDGNLKLKVAGIDLSKNEITCEVVTGGILKENKGINLPHTDIRLPSLTNKDILDLEFGIKNKVDYVAMSFVRTQDDIKLLRGLLKSIGRKVPIIAKIERPEAIKNIDSIISEADLIMVARGDLGVEISTEEVPVLQKMIIRKCNESIKPVITATQMLESMIENPTPTRAEASDIANAILDGTDCVMLSAETSTGAYPFLAVRNMKKIILCTETIKKSTYFNEIFVEDSPENTLHTICNSATEIAERVSARAIITITHNGRSPLLLSNHRPTAQIIAATYDDNIIRRCKLVWGVESILITKDTDYNNVVAAIREKIINFNILNKGDRIVIVSSLPLSEAESANMIQVSEL